MNYYSKKDLLETLEHYQIPLHQDIERVFSEREYYSNKICGYFISEANSVIETLLYSLDFEKHRDDDVSDFEVSYVMTVNEESMYFQDDAEKAEQLNEDTVMRLIPFAELEYGDYLCFFFEDFTLKPNIVLWDKEESEPYNAKITLIARSIDELIRMTEGNE